MNIDLLMYFFIYAFLGWVVEVIYHAIVQHKLANRGFLNGMLCPIYGVGMVILIVFLEPIKSNLVLLFLGAVVLCSLLELITGFVLKTLFKQRWWDYSEEKFNIGGYICLKFSLCWGFAGVFAVAVLHSAVEKLVGLVPFEVTAVVVVILTVLTVIDIAATVIDITGFNKELTHIDEMGDMIKAISDEITKMLYEESLDAEEAYMKRKLEIEQKKAELDALKAKAESKKSEITEALTRGQKRMLRAFPNIKSVNHRDTMEEIKQKIASFF